jgi:hypothetical protein
MDRQINEKLGEFDLLNEPGFKSISGAYRLHLVSTRAEWQNRVKFVLHSTEPATISVF